MSGNVVDPLVWHVDPGGEAGKVVAERTVDDAPGHLVVGPQVPHGHPEGVQRAMELVGRATALWPLAALGQGEAFDEQLLACQPLTQERFSSWEVGEALLQAHRLLPDDHSPRKRRMQRLARGVAVMLPEGPLRAELLYLAGDSLG